MFKQFRLTSKIIKQRLPVGLFALIGKQGAGKTSCAVAMLCNDFKYHGLERFEESKMYYRELNKCGFNLHLPKNQVMYFSSEEIQLSSRVKTWFIDPAKFKLPSLKEDVQYVPRYSVIFLPEFDNVINCRDWRSMSPYLIALAKFARHWDLTIILDFQCWLQIDVSYRRLMMYILFIYNSYFKEPNFIMKYIFKRKPKRIWNYVFCDNQLNAFIKDLNDMSVDLSGLTKSLKNRVALNQKYIFKGNIFERFESTSGARYFLRGITDYEYIPHLETEMTPTGIEEYCKTHPLTRE